MQRRAGTPRALQAAGLACLALTVVGCSSSQPTAVAGLVSPTASAAATSASAQPSQTPTTVASPVPSVRPSASSRSPAPAARPATAAAPTGFAFPVPVALGSATQVITVDAAGSYATVTAWQYAGGRWTAVISTAAARVGANGIVAASSRQQGTNTTPAGTFTLTQGFGIGANPGTRVAYHQVTTHDWWVEDNLSAYYNQMRTDTLGGFNTAWPEWYVNGSEHLITHTGTYQYAVVIDYNRWPAVHYKGAGIFLHVNGSGATAGCVSVPAGTMVALLRWLNPADHPRIAIGG